MKREESLQQCLIQYSNSDYYPFHMPGHKRQFGYPSSIDITEIDGFDNLHHPEGILKNSMEWAAAVYGAEKTYYLVNGSSCGILSAICAVTSLGGKLLMSRNCHKSAYHGVFLNQLTARYVYPQIIEEYGIQGGVLASDIQSALEEDSDIQAVLVVSPTYDGIVSDIEAIAEVVHRYQIPLIVDEAHGAHFRFGHFPQSAIQKGADLVIQSLHKTLPSYTQTALLHVKNEFVDLAKVERYLQIYQTSSPSYIFVSGIEECIRYMKEEGAVQMAKVQNQLHQLRGQLEQMKHLRLLNREWIGRFGVYDMDVSKIVISTRGTGLDGVTLTKILREQYHLEMEMSGVDYILAMITVADQEQGLLRLKQALLEVDAGLGCETIRNSIQTSEFPVSEQKTSISKALNADWEVVKFKNSQDRISAEFIYIYPPGIPIVAPGEVINQQIIDLIWEYYQQGLSVQGMAGEALDTIQVLK